MPSKQLFATFDVTRQVFFRSTLSIGIVNLKPLLPGHVLILPKRVVSRLADLDHLEITDLFLSVQKVGIVLEKAYKAQALTLSLQDGAVAGQSVPHVHIHLIPRHPTDYNGKNDEIYPALEKSEADLESDMKEKASAQNDTSGGWAKDEDRKPRSMEVMEEEARWLSTWFDQMDETDKSSLILSQ